MDISTQLMVTDKSNIVSQAVVPFGMCQPALHLRLTILTLNTVTNICEKTGCFMPSADFSPTSRNLPKGFLVAAC